MTANPANNNGAAPPPLTHRQQILDYFQSGCKTKDQWRIGTEHEKFLYRLDDGSLLPYRAAEDQPSIERLLKTLADRFAWTAVYEEDNIIAVTKGKYSINLESGGQLELSGAPLADIHHTQRELKLYLDELRNICKEHGVGILGIGYHPVAKMPERPVVPRTRSRILSEQGARYDQRWAMLSCAVQANYDYASEADMIKKLRVGLALQPIIVALFANSPFVEGRDIGYRSYRYHLNTKTHERQQAALMNLVFSEDMSFEAYIDFVMKERLLFVFRDGVYHKAADGCFKDFFERRDIKGLPPGLEPTMQDWLTQMSSIYSDVRLRNYLEMRGADAGGWRQLTALPAVWTGLLYDEDALEQAWQMVRNWSVQEMMAMRFKAAKDGLKARFGLFQHLQPIALKVLSIAYRGLRSRDILTDMGENETIYIDNAMTQAVMAKSKAELMLSELRDQCGNDFTTLIRRHSF